MSNLPQKITLERQLLWSRKRPICFREPALSAQSSWKAFCTPVQSLKSVCNSGQAVRSPSVQKNRECRFSRHFSCWEFSPLPDWNTNFPGPKNSEWSPRNSRFCLTTVCGPCTAFGSMQKRQFWSKGLLKQFLYKCCIPQFGRTCWRSSPDPRNELWSLPRRRKWK